LWNCCRSVDQTWTHGRLAWGC